MTDDALQNLKWPACLVAVLGVHVAIGMLVLNRTPSIPPPTPPEPIVIDLPSEPAASSAQPIAPVQPPPAPAPTPVPEAAQTATPEVVSAPPNPTDTEPPPPELIPPPELAPAPEAAIALPLPPPPPPRSAVKIPKPPPHPAPARSPARPEAQTEPSPAAPPRPAEPRPAPSSASAASAAAASSWRNLLLGRLQAAKRYPDRARSRGDQGVALVTFTMDRAGRLVSARLVQGSGSGLLDDEAVAMIARAEPLPPPPPDLPGARLTLTVPVSFALR